jgi:hypothetical protein
MFTYGGFSVGEEVEVRNFLGQFERRTIKRIEYMPFGGIHAAFFNDHTYIGIGGNGLRKLPLQNTGDPG